MNSENIINAQAAKRKRSGGGRAFHSRLEPFVDFIRELRQGRKTWREIARALSAEKSCAITAQGVHQFYRRHLRRRAKGHWEDESNQVAPQPAQSVTPAIQPPVRPAPLPVPPKFNRPNLSTINTKEFT